MARVLIALLMLTVSATMADADQRKNRNAGQGADEAVQRAVSEVHKRYQGRVLSARPIKGGDGTKVRVKFLSKDGVIRTLVVEADED